MFAESIPKELEQGPVTIFDGSMKPFQGKVAFKNWTPFEAFMRGFKRAGRIVIILLVLPLPFAFLEPFAFMVWGSISNALTLFVIGPYFHLKYSQELSSFFFVEGECPSCRHHGKLKPYVSAAFEENFTVLCPECGQTATVRK